MSIKKASSGRFFAFLPPHRGDLFEGFAFRFGHKFPHEQRRYETDHAIQDIDHSMAVVIQRYKRRRDREALTDELPISKPNRIMVFAY